MWAKGQARPATRRAARAILDFAPAFVADDLVPLAADLPGAGALVRPEALASHPLRAGLQPLAPDSAPRPWPS